jgi:hypothetical protein
VLAGDPELGRALVAAALVCVGDAAGTLCTAPVLAEAARAAAPPAIRVEVDTAVATGVVVELATGTRIDATLTTLLEHAWPTLACEAQQATSVATRMVFDAAPAAVWDRLMFYEQVEQRPPLHLRLLLPTPIETAGRKSEIGDEARCLYKGGYLVKRVTQVDPGRRYAFDVVEQALAVGGVTLSSGEYVISELTRGRAEVRIVTRYASPRWPRWLWRPIERAVCHSFHRHILRAMRRKVEVRS